MNTFTFVSVWSDKQSHVDSTPIFISQNVVVIKSTLLMMNSDMQLLVVSTQAISVWLISCARLLWRNWWQKCTFNASPRHLSVYLISLHHRSVCSSHWWLTIPYLLQLGAGIIGGPREEAHPDSALTSIKSTSPHTPPHRVSQRLDESHQASLAPREAAKSTPPHQCF